MKPGLLRIEVLSVSGTTLELENVHQHRWEDLFRGGLAGPSLHILADDV